MSLAVTCLCPQVQIFFALLSGVVLNSTETEPQERLMMGYILIGLQAVPPFVTAFLASPLSIHILDTEKRKKLFTFASKAQRKIAPKLELFDAKLRKKGKFARRDEAKYLSSQADGNSKSSKKVGPGKMKAATVAPYPSNEKLDSVREF